MTYYVYYYDEDENGKEFEYRSLDFKTMKEARAHAIVIAPILQEEHFCRGDEIFVLNEDGKEMGILDYYVEEGEKVIRFYTDDFIFGLAEDGSIIKEFVLISRPKGGMDIVEV